nr:hypothetical protein CFP56_26079 [Quercus suber]
MHVVTFVAEKSPECETRPMHSTVADNLVAVRAVDRPVAVIIVGLEVFQLPDQAWLFKGLLADVSHP